jgi:hypothetical protein
VDGSRADPAVVGVWVDVAAAHDGDDVPAGEAVTVFEDQVTSLIMDGLRPRP